MSNIMKLVSLLFVVFIQIQIGLSQPIKYPTGSDAVHELCHLNIYPSLCISTFNLDPRSKNSTVQGFAFIVVDATSKKVKEELDYLNSVVKTIRDRAQLKSYRTCIEEYGVAVGRFLPAAFTDVKALKYYQAMSDLKSVVSVPNICEKQFAGKSPLTGRNKAIHDIAAMSADLIRYLIANN